MPLTDRTIPLCDLLLGAAYADAQFKERERAAVRDLLATLSGNALTEELEARIDAFDPQAFDLAATAASFTGDTEDDRRGLLVLVAGVNDSDDELDLAEDDYLRSLARALALPDDALSGLALEVEVEDLREEFQKLRKGPPPVPGTTAGA